jgi:hypothetical protein
MAAIDLSEVAAPLRLWRSAGSCRAFAVSASGCTLIETRDSERFQSDHADCNAALAAIESGSITWHRIVRPAYVPASARPKAGGAKSPKSIVRLADRAAEAQAAK